MQLDETIETQPFRWFASDTLMTRSRRQLFSIYLFGMGLLIGLPYLLINHFIPMLWVSDVQVDIALDSSIPFIPSSLVPYLSLYLYYPIFAYLLAKEQHRSEGIEMMRYFLLMTWISFAFFMAFPTEIHLRPEPRPERFERLYQVLYSIDQPFNAWPSLHVAQSLFILLASVHLKSNENEMMWYTKLVLIVFWICLVLSTLTTKQHYVFDAVSGALLGWGTWKFYQRNSRAS